ncbi:hypothetical protein DFJ43DRAFT_1079606 [Lentinula guzmanii]|uniref:F-box domain-containing protein n=2 Tax=Lentinula TaxID=5352 RepID=A0AA38N0C7_9AGAR|nr:hypothetical protein DFJ43DRAFT_1079606 [Lentinula guzmanii]KAJ3785003.1 hypothetical protein GGU10DRAFT_356140 [Lentinula aff. detonsa]
MVDLPFDIWWKVFEILPPDARVHFRAVNRLFLEIARRVQYRYLVIDGYGKRTKRLMKTINSLSLGYHVQSLHIQPWAVSNLPSAKAYLGPGGRVSSVFDHLHSFFDSDFPTRRAEALVRERMRKQIRLVKETAGMLKFVQEYSLEWNVDRPYHPELFTAFLSLVDVSPFGQTLTKLSLKVPTDRLICLASVKLPALEQLDLQLVTMSLSERCINDCFDCFAVFVNNLCPTLSSLSVSSSHISLNLNLYRLFYLLGDFPHLRSLAVTIPYDGAHFSSLDSLQFFIRKHRQTLQELKLLCNRSAARTRPNDPCAKYWIQRTITDVCAFGNLTNLSSIELSLRPLRSELTPFLTFLASAANQLESLTLTDDALTPEEVERVLDAVTCRIPADSTNRNFAGYCNLGYLAIRLQYLCPYTVDLFASKLCLLRSLKLTFSDVRLHHRDEVQLSYTDYAYAYFEELRLFYAEMNSRWYPEWKLSSLAVSECPYRFEWGRDLEKVFTKCIPTLDSFQVF